MKNTLFGLASFVILSSVSVAADVSLYGVVDLGFNYAHQNSTVRESSLVAGSRTETFTRERCHSFQEASSLYSPTSWGLRGREKIADGYFVAFHLKAAFSADTGATPPRLFQRESRLTVESPYGSLSFGRVGALTSSMGSYDIFLRKSEIYDGGYSTHLSAIGGSGYFCDHAVFDNMFTYVSPDLAGLKLYAQYSLKNDSLFDAGEEGTHSVNRYIGLGATYENGPLTTVFVLDSLLQSHENDSLAERHLPHKKSLVASLGGNYDFGRYKLYFSAQWGKNELSIGANSRYFAPNALYDPFMDAFTVHAGVEIPLASAHWKTGLYYSRGKNTYGKNRFDPAGASQNRGHARVRVFNIATSYEYHLSKRTDLYVGFGYSQSKVDDGCAGLSSDLPYRLQTLKKTKFIETVLGLCHNF